METNWDVYNQLFDIAFNKQYTTSASMVGSEDKFDPTELDVQYDIYTQCYVVRGQKIPLENVVELLCFIYKEQH